MKATIADRRISAHVRETPLRHSLRLSASTGANVFLKLENLQETGSFKLRGAANKLLLLTRDQAARGVIAASNGNHALAVATIGRKLGIPVEVFVSEHVDPVRRDRIEALQAIVQTVKGDSLLAEQTARRTAELSGRAYVSPYNDRDVIAGQGTIAVEILRQLAQAGSSGLDAVFVAVGGGGLIGGLGMHLKSVSPATRIVGCWPENSPVLHECLRAGEIIDVPEKPTLSVSTTGGMEAEAVTLGIARQVIDRKVLVTEAEILAASRRIYREDDQLVEGAAAVAVAAFLRSADDYAGKTVVIVICGGNADPGLKARIKEP
ncbi:MAG: threonine/serine dehydratase [Pseudomonadota bacterium]|nr:threonine/serine dehydratase [Pseudomonadota bacterium]